MAVLQRNALFNDLLVKVLQKLLLILRKLQLQMKHIILLLFLGATFTATGQFDFSPEEVKITGTDQDESVYTDYDVINASGAEASTLWILDREEVPAEWEFQICDKNNCYLWGREDCPEANPNVFSADESWAYKLTVRPHGTAAVGTVSMNILDMAGAVIREIPIEITIDGVSSVDDLDSHQVNIYPNPTSDLFQISNDDQVAKVAFFNIVGKRINTATHFAGKSHDVSQLQKGIYLVRLLDTEDNVLSVVRLNKN